MKAFYLLAVWCTSLLTISSAAARSCYYPDGSLATGDTLCNSNSTGHASCCGAYDRCMDSGLCYTSGIIYRGSCSDPNFKDPACSPYCQDWIKGDSCPVIPRQWTTTTTNHKVADIGWCCGFPLSNGSCAQGFQIKVSAGNTISRFATTPDEVNCKANHDVAIGVGLGVPFLVVVIALLGLWLWERRKRQRTSKVEEQPEKLESSEKPAPFSFYEPEPSDISWITPSPASATSTKPQVELSPVQNPRISEVDGAPKLNELPAARF